MNPSKNIIKNLNLTDTEKIIIDTVKKFSSKELLPNVNKDFKKSRTRELYEKFGEEICYFSYNKRLNLIKA